MRRTVLECSDSARPLQEPGGVSTSDTPQFHRRLDSRGGGYNDFARTSGGTFLPTRTANDLEQLLDQIEKEALPIPPESVERVAKAIAAIFRLKADEVAILEIAPPGKLLRFVIPAQLRAVGTIPLSSTSALAARTVRTRRAEVVNNFHSFPHATVFEGVPMGRRYDESIHKIVSAPILSENRVIGVVQLCRKGISLLDAGPDFAASDLAELKGLSNLLVRFLALTRA
jgi:hypothetical protein